MTRCADGYSRTGSDALIAGKSLSAGSYTIEATTAAPRVTGDFMLTVSVAGALPPPRVEISGLADASATPAVGGTTAAVSDEFDVVPADASCVVSATAGTASVSGDGNRRTVTARIASGAAASVTVTVTCSQAPLPQATATAVFTAAPADGCDTPLGVLGEGLTTRSGTIAADAACTTAHRYTTASGWVTVDLHSDPAESPRLDTYLVLSGDSLDRPIRNDDARDTSHGRYYYDSRIGPLLLPAGDYVAEATTYGTGKTGSYTLTAEITATGLAQTHTATVGAPKTITFRYWPPDAQIAVSTAAAEEFALAVAATAHTAYGTATIALTPRLVHDHRLTVGITSNSGTRERLLNPITLTAACPSVPVLPGGPSLATSTHNGVLCIPSPAPATPHRLWAAMRSLLARSTGYAHQPEQSSQRAATGCNAGSPPTSSPRSCSRSDSARSRPSMRCVLIRHGPRWRCRAAMSAKGAATPTPRMAGWHSITANAPTPAWGETGHLTVRAWIRAERLSRICSRRATA